MSLSVSSFPEAPPKLVQQPKSKWQVVSSLKTSGRHLGTLLSKRPVLFLKGIGHFAKTHVKGSIVRQRAKVSRSLSISKHLSRSSIRPSSTVIDISPISNDDKYFYPRSDDFDASSLNPTIDISLSPTTSPPTAAKDIPAISPTDPVEAPYQSSVHSLVGDSAHAHETIVQNPSPKANEEVASDTEPHDPQPPDSEITTALPISPATQSLTVPAVWTEGRRRSHSASAGVKTSAIEMVPRTRPRYKSETAIGLPHLTTITPFKDSSSSAGKDSSRGENPLPRSPATGSTHTSESKKQRQQRRETTSKRTRARSGASTKSTGSNKAVESPRLSAHVPSTRSAGSRLSANSRRSSSSPSAALPLVRPFSSNATALIPTPSPEQMMDLLQAPPHLRPKTTDVAPPPSLVVVSPSPSSGDAASEQSPLPSAVDRGRWLRLVAVPHAESWDGEQQQQRGRPRTAPEAVLMASW